MSSGRTNLPATPVISQDTTPLAALNEKGAMKIVQKQRFSQHSKLVLKLALEPALNYLKLRVSQKTLVTL